MKNKSRNLYKQELKLWKEITKNDNILKEYDNYSECEKIKPVQKNNFVNKDIKSSNPKETRIKEKIKKVKSVQINNRMRKNLERGKIRPEATLDLHGFNKSDARFTLSEFIKKNVDRNLRCILVITGKKKSTLGAKGILRESLPLWLEEENISKFILSHSFASIKDGGDGARYVLLRKKEKVFYEEDS